MAEANLIVLEPEEFEKISALSKALYQASISQATPYEIRAQAKELWALIKDVKKGADK